MVRSGKPIRDECEDVRWVGLPARLPDVGRRGRQRAPVFLPTCAGVGCRTKLYFSVEQGRKDFGGGAVTCRGGREARSWGSGAGPAGRVPSGPGARLPARPRVSGSSMATRRRRATRSRPTFKSKWLKPQALGGRRDPRSPVLPEGCSPQRNAGGRKGSGAPRPPGKAYGGRGAKGANRVGLGGRPASDGEGPTRK